MYDAIESSYGHPPPNVRNDVPVLHKLNESYKLWHGFLTHLPRLSRYTIGAKIDTLFTDTIELILLASYAARDQKLTVLQKANVKFDALKFFLELAWEMKLLENKHYALLSPPLVEVGKMLGKWTAFLKNETPARAGE